MAKAKKITKKATTEAVETHPDTQRLDDLHKHIQERIADGGATTDHLKAML